MTMQTNDVRLTRPSDAVDGDPHTPDIAILVYCLEGGGVQRQTYNLAAELAARGLRVAYVAVRAVGELAASLPPAVELIELLPKPAWQKPSYPDRIRDQIRALPRLIDYLRRHRPAVVLSGGSHMNFSAVKAHKAARSTARLVLRLTNHMSQARGRYNPLRWLLSAAASSFYPYADRIVAVSHDVRDDFLDMVPACPPAKVHMIREPVITPRTGRMIQDTPQHPWLNPDEPPVVLAIGRIAAQKDFATLIRAFALARRKRPVRLIIVGAVVDNARAARLRRLVEKLGIAADVDFVGYTMNPYAYLARAAVFALSSRFEGCPNVLAEAIYCGCPIVATKCPGGVEELLGGGPHGTLVPVGDAEAMSEALLAAIDRGRDAPSLTCPEGFDLETSATRYMEACYGTDPVN